MTWLLFIILVYVFSRLFTEKYEVDRNFLKAELSNTTRRYKNEIELLRNEVDSLKRVLKEIR